MHASLGKRQSGTLQLQPKYTIMCSYRSLLVLLTAGAVAAGSIEVLSPPDAVVGGPDGQWLDVPADHQLHLRCSGGREPLSWSLPFWSDTETDNVTTVQCDHARGYCQSELLLPRVRYNMTGNYSCQPEGSSIYVFVNDPNHLVVPYEETTDYLFISVFQSKPAVIPCRATYSQAEVTLWKSSLTRDRPPEQMKPNRNLGLEFDPTRGFVFEHPRWDTDTSVLQCQFRVVALDRQATSTIHVHWSILPSELDPIIDDSEAQQVFLHDSFRLRCFVHIDLGVIILLEWEPPNTNAADRIIKSEAETTPEVVNNNLYHTVSVNMTVLNATEADQGLYRCVATDADGRTFVASKQITILDRHAPTSVNLSAEFEAGAPVVVAAGNPVQLSVLADAWPDISLVQLLWLKDGRPLPTDGNQSTAVQQRHELQTANRTRLSLLIESARASDSGVYTLMANATTTSSHVSAMLYVTGEPELLLDGDTRQFYVLDTSYRLVCHRYGYPTGPVWWQWLACHTPESCLESPEHQQLWLNVTGGQVEQQTLLPYHNASALTVTASISGWFRCWTPYAGDGPKHQDWAFIVMDAEALLAVTAWPEEPTVNDTLRVSCKASVFRYVQVWWTAAAGPGASGRAPVQEKPGMRLSSHSNQYSISASIEWAAVDQRHDGLYACEAVPRFDARKVDRIEWPLRVQNVSAPRWLDTNQASETVVKAGYNSQTELRCLVDGRPPPRLHWFRNGMPLSFDGHDSGVRLEQHGQRLVFTRLLEKDSGQYECRATNRAGSLTRKLLLHVQPNGDDFLVPANELVFAVLFSLMATVLIGTACLLGAKLRRQQATLSKPPLPVVGAFSQNIFEHGRMELFNPAMPLDEQTDLLPYDPRFEFPKDRLLLGPTLGQGAFGRVVKAKAIGLDEQGSVSTVAVKMLKERADANQQKALMAELKILVHLGRHLNIVNLLGAVTKNLCRGELLVIVEFCEHGNLRHYLLANRDRFVNQLDPVTGRAHRCYQNISFEPESPPPSDANGQVHHWEAPALAYYNKNYVGLAAGPTRPANRSVTTTDLICWAFQCARGMDYLTMRKLIHRDLAARNVLLASDNVVKICDFGLAKDVYKYDNYVKKDDGPLPIKWMAIESISDKVFTSKSDVWSYGILLWELFTLGQNPYPGIEIDEEFYKRLKNGYRMEKPELSSEHLYHLMLRCWDADPNRRPDFGKIADEVGDLLDDQTKKHYIELNNPYLEMNQQILATNDYLKMTAMSSGGAGDHLQPPPEECHYETSTPATAAGPPPADLIELALLERPCSSAYDNLSTI